MGNIKAPLTKNENKSETLVSFINENKTRAPKHISYGSLIRKLEAMICYLYMQ